MKKNSLCYLLYFFFLICSKADGMAVEKNPPPLCIEPVCTLQDIRKWIGKYPFDKIEGYNLLSTKLLKKNIKDILGKHEYKEFSSIEALGVATPVLFVDGIISFTVCQKHNCDHKLYFLFEVSGKNLFICKRESHFDPKKEHFDWTFVWYSKKGKQAAAKEYCEFYDASKQIMDWKRTFADIPSSLK
jgi:hypothetical protein